MCSRRDTSRRRLVGSPESIIRREFEVAAGRASVDGIIGAPARLSCDRVIWRLMLRRTRLDGHT